ncbi:MAG TPA: MaoC family dehydratase N-terminal domain-containing protein [bacterium]|nr:MaoC family dehydratase N-terminal domain-containing protein [bacterium]
MAVDTGFIGKKYPTHVYEIGKEKIREYARAVGDKNPVYLDDEAAENAGYDCVVAPPTFAAVYAAWPVGEMLLDKELALNLMMLVHGEQDFEFGEVVSAGDVITTESEIVEIYEKAGKDFVTMETISTNQKGNLACKGRWTFVIRG